jgi:hypothetical protein
MVRKDGNIGAHFIDGALRGVFLGTIWGFAFVDSYEGPTKAISSFRSKLFQSSLKHAMVFGSFLSIYSGACCALDKVTPQTNSAAPEIMNAGLAGCLAGYTAAYVDTRSTRLSGRPALAAGLCTAAMTFVVKRRGLGE